MIYTISKDGYSGDLINALNSLIAGDTLIVHEGVYDCGSAPFTFNYKSERGRGITIKGADGERVEFTGATPGTTVRIDYAEFLNLENLVLSIHSANPVIKFIAGMNINFTNIEIDGKNISKQGIAGGNVDALPGIHDCTFAGVKIHNNTDHGFKLYYAASNFVFDACEFYNNACDGFSGRSNRDDKNHGRNMVFRNTSFHDNGQDGVDVGIKDGVVLFDNCSAERNGFSGYKFWNTNTVMLNCSMADNFYGMSVKPLWGDPAKIHFVNCKLAGTHKWGTVVFNASSGENIIGPVVGYLYNTEITTSYPDGRLINVENPNAEVITVC